MSMMDLLTVVNTTISIPLDVMILYTDYKTFGTESMTLNNKDCYKTLLENKSILDMILADNDSFTAFFGSDSICMKDEECYKAAVGNKKVLDRALTNDTVFSSFLVKGEEYASISILLNALYNTSIFNELNTWLDIIQDPEAVSTILGSSHSKIILNAGMKDVIYSNVDVSTASVSFSTAHDSGWNSVSGHSFGDPITGVLTKVSIIHSHTGVDGDMFSTNVSLNVANLGGYAGSGNNTVSYADNPIPLNNVVVETTGSERNDCGIGITTTVRIEYYKLPREVNE